VGRASNEGTQLCTDGSEGWMRFKKIGVKTEENYKDRIIQNS
jgi:hypothetical protein